MSTATWLFAAGPSRGKVRRRRVLGPVGTGPRLEPRSLYKNLGSFPLHRRFGSKRATPERGQMLRRTGVKPLATFTSRGPRRQTAGMEFGAALRYAVRSSPSSLDQLLGLHSLCSLPPAADRSRRLSAPRLGLPALGWASPADLLRSSAPPSILERG